MRASFARASGPPVRPAASPAPNSRDCARPSAKFSPSPSAWEGLRSRTTSMPSVRPGSSSSSTASIAEPARPAGAAAQPSGASSLAAGEPTIAPTARDEVSIYCFLEKHPVSIPDCRAARGKARPKAKKIKRARNGPSIANPKAPVMYPAAGKYKSQPEETQGCRQEQSPTERPIQRGIRPDQPEIATGEKPPRSAILGRPVTSAGEKRHSTRSGAFSFGADFAAQFEVRGRADAGSGR